MNPMLNISSSPHLKDKQTTKFIMYAVIIALLPATAAGIMVNGLRALLIVAASVAICALVDANEESPAPCALAWRPSVMSAR